MGLLDYFRREPEAETKSRTLDQIIRDYHAMNPASGGVIVNETTALKVSTVMACVQLVANDVAKLPMALKLRQADGSLVQPPNRRNKLPLVERAPNEWQTCFDMVQMMTAQAMLRGEAFAYKGIDRAGNLRALYPLTRSEVSVEWEQMTPLYHVSAYDGGISGVFERSRIVHLRGFSWDGKGGLDRVFTARDSIGLAAAAEGIQGSALKNGNRMPGYWTTDGTLTDEQIDRIVAQLVAQTSGKNAFKSPVLDAGLKYATTGQSFEDSQLIETRKHQIVEVCAAFGVLPSVLGIDDKTQAFASVEAMMAAHVKRTLWPWLRAWEGALDRDLLDRDGPLCVKFDTSELEKATTAERAESYRTLVELGIMTRNEARDREGLPRLEGLDEPLTPLNMQGAQMEAELDGTD